jgi:RHS repeat-associated protein
LVVGLCFLAGALLAPGTALAAECTHTWTGAVSADWQVVENWSPEEVPGAADVACIPKEKTAQVLSGTHSVEVLQGEGQLTILSGSLALLGPEGSHIQKLHISGGALKGPAELLVTESLHADGGSMEGAGNTVVGAEASGHVDALEGGEGPGLRLTEKRELNVKGVLEVAGLGGQINAIEGSFLGVLNAGELAVKGPEGEVALSESADLVNAKDLFVGGPEGRLVLADKATLLNSKDLVLESPSGGLISQDETSIENSGTLIMRAAAGEIRAEGSSIDNSGTLTIKAPEGRIRGSKGATLDNSGTLVINGEGEGNGLAAGTGTVPKLTNTGTVLKDEGLEMSIIEFKVDNEDLVEVKSGVLAFTGGGNSGQEHLDAWSAVGEETQVVFATGAFTFGEKAAMNGVIAGLASASLKGHRFAAEEAEVWLAECSLEITGAEEESRFATIATSSGGEVDLIKNGVLFAEEAFIESGSLEAGEGSSLTIPSFEQASGSTTIGADASVRFEWPYVAQGSLDIGPSSDVQLGSFYQEEGETSIGAGAEVEADSPYIEHGSFTIGANSEANLGNFFQQEGETAFGAGSTVELESPFVEHGSFLIGVGSNADLGRFYLDEGTVTIGAGSTVEAEETYVESGSLDVGENVVYALEELYLQEGTIDVATGASATMQEGYFQAGLLEGAGAVVANELGWETTTMAGSGSTKVTEFGAITADESDFASLDGRRLVTQGFFTAGKATLMMANGARLQNEAEFDASSEASSLGAQIRIGESSATSPRIVNKHEFNKESGSGTTEVTVPFENNGSIGQFSGTLHIVNRLGVPASEKFGFRCYCGDPVETASGDFSESQTDLAIGGRGVGLVLTRSYSAQAAAAATSSGAFGFGWFNSFGDRLDLEEEGKRITVVRADGSTVPFLGDGEGGFDPPAWNEDTLAGNSETGYTYKGADQIEYAFAPSGALQSVIDRNGNETTLAYTEAGRLKSITDPAERQITFAYNGEGLVESVEDPMGHTVQYAYKGKELAGVTLPGDEEPRWQFEYDPSHRMTTMIDGRGGETVNEYDGADRVLMQTDPAGRTQSFDYDGFHTRFENEVTEAITDLWFNSNNQPTSITRGYGTEDAVTETFSYDEAGHQVGKADGNGHTTTFTYNPAGDRMSMTDADENETKWKYNGTHDVISETTPNGLTTTIERDAAGNPETISRPAPGEATQTTSFEHDGLGQLESRTDPLNRTWSYEYNAQGDRKSETSPEGETWTWTYDENSQLISNVSPRGNEEGAEASEFTTTIERDAQGRPEEVIDPLGNETKYAYDPNGNLESETDAKGHTKEFVYNPADELIETKKPNGAVLKTEYDGAGEVVAQIDGNNNVTTFVRNVLGQPVEIIDPLERKTIQEFDAAGNLETATDPAARTTTYSYDLADRLEEVAYSDEATPDASFEYDPDGNLTRMVDGSGESTYDYDQLGRLEEATNGNGDTVAYEYSLADEQERIVYPNGKGVDQAFDDSGRLESITDWLGKTTTFAYDADSNMEAIEFPAATGNLDEFSYDRTGRMTSVTMKKGAESLAAITYERDELGQIESMESEGLPGPKEETYEYDENNRLIKAGSESFEYDLADNPIKTPGSTNAFDKASQLESGTGVTYEYNPMGERTKATPSSGPATNYSYDQAGNLTSVNRAKEGEVPGVSEAFSYDGVGLKTSQTVGELSADLTWDLSSGLPLLLDDEQASYIYGPGGLPIEQISSEETPTYHHHDQLGSTKMLTSPAGETSGAFTYRAYGLVLASSGSQTTPLGFAGQYSQPQSDLQYLRVRSYDGSTAQFLSADPLVWLTGSPYLYASGNPLKFTDPSGLCDLGPFCGLNPCAGPVAGPLCEAGRAVGNAGAGVVDELGSPLPSYFPGPELNLGPTFRDLTGIFEDAEECSEEYGKARKITSIAKTLRDAKKGVDILKKALRDGFPDLSSPLPDLDF